MGYGELLVGFEWWSHDSPPFLVLLFEVIVILLFLFPLYTKDYPRAHLVGWCVLYKLIWWWWLFLTGGTVCSSCRSWSMLITRLSCHLFWSSLVLLGFFIFVGGWVYHKGDIYCISDGSVKRKTDTVQYTCLGIGVVGVLRTVLDVRVAAFLYFWASLGNCTGTCRYPMF